MAGSGSNKVSSTVEIYSTSPPWRAVQYPESDGKPMAESDAHYESMTDLRFALQRFLEAQGITAYVGANMLLYYEEGDPTHCVAPDIFVVLGAQPGRRTVYKVWVEGKAPDVVIELTSKSTRADDLGVKLGVYILLGVQEYFVFDPRQEYLEPRLRGFRRAEGTMLPMVESPLISRVLGLELVSTGDTLRLRPPGSKDFLPTPREEAERAEAEAQRAEAEARRAEAEARRAEAEAKARAEAEAELEQLRAELERLRSR